MSLALALNFAFGQIIPVSVEKKAFFSSHSSLRIGGTLHTCPPITGPESWCQNIFHALAACHTRLTTTKGQMTSTARRDTFSTIHEETDKIRLMPKENPHCRESDHPPSFTASRSGRPPGYHPSCPCQAATSTLACILPLSPSVFPRRLTLACVLFPESVANTISMAF